jgi:hypothetical protein
MNIASSGALRMKEIPTTVDMFTPHRPIRARSDNLRFAL